MSARLGWVRLLSGSCSSARTFAPRFFQPRLHSLPPCVSLQSLRPASGRTFTSSSWVMLGTHPPVPPFLRKGGKNTSPESVPPFDKGGQGGFAGRLFYPFADSFLFTHWVNLFRHRINHKMKPYQCFFCFDRSSTSVFRIIKSSPKKNHPHERHHQSQNVHPPPLKNAQSVGRRHPTKIFQRF